MILLSCLRPMPYDHNSKEVLDKWGARHTATHVADASPPQEHANDAGCDDAVGPAAWMTVNTAGLVPHFDPYPFIFLNLVFSVLRPRQDADGGGGAAPRKPTRGYRR